MKLYLSHSSGYDYKTELYEPLKAAFSNEQELFLPHESHADGINTKDVIPDCDLILAEVSLPSTGQGIELGWADVHSVPIVCFYRTDSTPSSALRFISNSMVEYSSTDDMIGKLKTEIEKFV